MVNDEDVATANEVIEGCTHAGEVYVVEARQVSEDNARGKDLCIKIDTVEG